jgi:two-component system, NtrC family, sensor kinase
MTSSALVAENKLRGSALAESLAARAVNPLLAQDYLVLRNMVGEVGDVVYAFIQNAEGRVVTHSFAKGYPVELVGANRVGSADRVRVQLIDTGEIFIYDFAAPIMVAGERIGTVRIGLSKSRLSATTKQFVSALATMFGGVLLAAMALGSVFARTVTRRLARLRSHAEDLVTGSLDNLSVLPGEHFCWEIMNCREKSCPAHHDRVRRCWLVPDTKCAGHACIIGPKPASCRDCLVFLQNVGDEIQDLAESLDFMAFTLRDHIRGLREAEQTLTNQQRLLSTVLDMNPDLISLVDTRMIYQTANRAFAQSVGKTVEEMRGLNDFHLFPRKRRSAGIWMAVRCSSPASAWTGRSEWTALTAASGSMWFRSRCMTSRAESSVCCAWIATSRTSRNTSSSSSRRRKWSPSANWPEAWRTRSTPRWGSSSATRSC